MLVELTSRDILHGFLTSAGSTRLMFKHARERAMYRQTRKRALESLIKSGYVTKNAELVSLTNKGRRRCERSALATRSLLDQKKTWDHKWRIVIYDIPQELHALRGELRDILKRAGFRMVQRSVWIFPHECRELLALLKREEKRLKPHVLYVTVEDIEYGEKFCAMFGLNNQR